MALQIIGVIDDNQQQIKQTFLVIFYFQLSMTHHERQQHVQNLRAKYSHQKPLPNNEPRLSRQPSVQYMKKIFSSSKNEQQQYIPRKNVEYMEEKPVYIEKKENRTKQRKTRTMNELQRQIQGIRKSYALSRQRILEEHPKTHQRNPRLKEETENEKPTTYNRKYSVNEEEGSPIKIMKDFTQKKKVFEEQNIERRGPLKTKENSLNDRINKKLEEIQRSKENNEKVQTYLEHKKQPNERVREGKNLRGSQQEQMYSFDNIDRIQERIQNFLATKQ